MDDAFCSRDFRDACQYFTKFCRTITISPPLQDNTNENVQAMYLKIHQALKGFCLDYLLLPEFKDSRIHFHGVIKFRTKDQIELFCSRSHMIQIRKIGMVHIDGIPHPKWIQYMFKEVDITSQLMFNYTIIKKSDDHVPFNIMRSLIEDEDDYTSSSSDDETELINYFSKNNNCINIYSEDADNIGSEAQ